MKRGPRPDMSLAKLGLDIPMVHVRTLTNRPAMSIRLK